MQNLVIFYRRSSNLWLSRCLSLAACLGTAGHAQAVFVQFTSAPSTPKQISLRIGSANATVNSVTFSVNNAAALFGGSPTAGVPGNGAPTTSPPGGIDVRVRAQLGTFLVGSALVTLSANSSAGMTCQDTSQCGNTNIPFTTVSWTAFNAGQVTNGGTTYSTMPSGTFNGSTSQLVSNFVVARNSAAAVNDGLEMSVVLNFQYSNTQIYPAGPYNGRVTYTATLQ